MSWDSYIDSVIMQSGGAADRACIIGLNDGALWTSSSKTNALKPQATEGAKIATAFTTKNFSTLQTAGITVEGVTYSFLREEEGKVILGKKKDAGAITCRCTKTAVIIAHTKEGASQLATNDAVLNIATYLEGMGQ